MVNHSVHYALSLLYFLVKHVAFQSILHSQAVNICVLESFIFVQYLFFSPEVMTDANDFVFF